MKDIFHFVGVLMAVMAFFYVLENTDRFSRIADKALDSVENFVTSSPGERIIYKDQSRLLTSEEVRK